MRERKRLGSPTGRLNKSEPAIQNIPIRTKEGAALKRALYKKPPKVETKELEERIMNSLGRAKPKRAIKKTCARQKCSKEFETYNINKKFCSHDCQLEEARDRDSKKHGKRRREARKAREAEKQPMPWVKKELADKKAAKQEAPRAPLVLERVPEPTPANGPQVKEALAQVGLTVEQLIEKYRFGDGFEPSPQQAGLFDWVKTGTGNAFVEAVAGSGKTTSLVRACTFMTGKVVAIAFGKKIADEFGLKLQELGLHRIESATCHRLGFRALRNHYKTVKVADRGEKMEEMLDFLKPAGAEVFPTTHAAAVRRLVSLAKQNGVMITWDLNDDAEWWELIGHYNIADLLEDDREEHIKLAISWAKAGLVWCRKVAERVIDFDDMVWIPLVENFAFEKYNWVLVDESQDLNLIRRLLVRKLMKEGTRVIFVGDRHQAIFGFTGADSASVDNIIREFECIQLPLTVCYRCGKSIVTEAQKYVSHIVAHEKLPLGTVFASMDQKKFEELMPSLSFKDAIICRYTKPLCSLAFKFIRANIPVHVEGRSIGDGLVSLARKWKVKTVAELEERLKVYVARETEKFLKADQDNRIDALNDRVDTLRIFMEEADTVDQVVSKITTLFKDTDGSNKATVTLATCHRAKGREWDQVFILGFYKFMPARHAKLEWEQQQEKNLIYVAITRAKNTLVYLDAIEEQREAA